MRAFGDQEGWSPKDLVQAIREAVSNMSDDGGLQRDEDPTFVDAPANGEVAPRPAVRRAKTVRRDRPRTQWRSHEYGAAVDSHYLTGRVALAH